ncbi:hypothetical protein B0H13DRAFT_2306295 [Mycena leptocephala]|nr:hypothetical protein B0H13DRAFT_2306295 [Mycena leptocephala]
MTPDLAVSLEPKAVHVDSKSSLFDYVIRDAEPLLVAVRGKIANIQPRQCSNSINTVFLESADSSEKGIFLHASECRNLAMVISAERMNGEQPLIIDSWVATTPLAPCRVEEDLDCVERLYVAVQMTELVRSETVLTTGDNATFHCSMHRRDATINGQRTTTYALIARTVTVAGDRSIEL